VRRGAEEFLLVLPQTDADGENAVPRRLGHAGLGFNPWGAAQTASVQFAERNADAAHNWTALVDLADQRMYAAKRAGSNRYAGPDGIFINSLSSVTKNTSVLVPAEVNGSLPVLAMPCVSPGGVRMMSPA
jgi:hypothetical protein